MGRNWLIFLLGVFALPSWVNASDSSSEVIFRAFQEEMDRSLQELKTEDFPAPYFINYQIRHNHHIEVSGSFGALLDSLGKENRTLFVDIRIGSPEFDSSTPGSHKANVRQLIPLDNNLQSLKRALWYETDIRYKQAVMNLLRKKGRKFTGIEKYQLANLSRGNAPVVHMEPVPELEANISEWQDLVRKVSAYFTRYPKIEKSRVKVILDRSIRYYLDSEGNKIQDGVRTYRVLMETWIKNDLGIQIHDEESIYFSSLKQFPSEEELIQRAEHLIRETIKLEKAPKMAPYVGPAIFSPEAAAVLFHEAIGHRLEGDRLRMNNDGKTFLKKIGKPILPSFISIVDDPQMKTSEGIDLLGHFDYDDQGQKSEKVVLIDKGILQNFLLSRTPVPGFHKSNGHGRSDGVRFPVSRMGNFVVKASKKLPEEQLKERLIEEVKKQNKPFGLIIKKMVSGETMTNNSDFQVFKGKPLFVYKVYPEDGREELVRGVEFVGTPLTMISHILTAGDDMTVTNGFCVAESGALPVSSIAPSILLSQVELQTSHEMNLRKPILAPPPLQ